MRFAKLVAVVMVASLLLAVAPAPLLAADGAAAVPGLRVSVDRAAKALAAQAPVPAPAAHRRAPAAAMQNGGGGGGGGKTVAIITLIGTIGGLAATYFIVKQTQKQSTTGQ